MIAELQEAGAAATALAAHGIRIPPIDGAGRHPNVQAEPAFQKGWFEVQDEGSQVVAELAGATPAMQVLDFCAGAGGKTLALSAAMENRGQIFAHDSDKSRIAPIFDRIRRSENRNIQVVTKPGELAGLAGRMDLVLVDAPCTGSGTWRRRPDAKWRLTRRQLDARLAEQASILQEAARFVKPGGRLVYVTCSVFHEENQRQVAAFLPGNPAFAPLDHVSLFETQPSGQVGTRRASSAMPACCCRLPAVIPMVSSSPRCGGRLSSPGSTMDNFIDQLTNPISAVGHLNYILVILSVSMSSMRWLRIFGIASGLTGVIYYGFLVSDEHQRDLGIHLHHGQRHPVGDHADGRPPKVDGRGREAVRRDGDAGAGRQSAHPHAEAGALGDARSRTKCWWKRVRRRHSWCSSRAALPASRRPEPSLAFADRATSLAR